MSQLNADQNTQDEFTFHVKFTNKIEKQKQKL